MRTCWNGSCSAKPYDRNLSNLSDLDAHLTNTCRLTADGGMHTSSGVDTAHQLPPEETLVQLLSELPQAFAEEQGLTLAEAGQRCRQAARDVNALIGETFDAVSNELTFFTLPNCWELFGFDLMLDENWHVWLLEANAEPDLQQTGTRLKPVIASLVEGCLQLVADDMPALKGHASAKNFQRGPCTNKQSLESQSSRGHWIEVLSKSMGREEGHSGIVVR